MATTEHDQAGERWTEYVPLESLRPNEANPKGHSIEELRASFSRFGYAELIMLDERTGLLSSGHGRRRLLLDDFAAGQEPPDGVRVAEDGSWLVPVSRGWASRDDDEAYAMLIAANRLVELGGWEGDLLAGGLQHLAALDAGLVGTGYTREALDDMLAVLAPPLSLDNLADQVGTSDPSDFWPVLRTRVDPQVWQRYLKVAGHLTEDADRLAWLVEVAESQAVKA